jgi:hypothetical protein
MNDRDWYLKNRSREAIVDMFRVIEHLQQINGFKRSEIITAMISVWRERNDALLAGHLMYMLRSLRYEERRMR